MKNKGFTLVELIVVIAIISVIMLIGVPAFASIMERMKVRADKASANEIGEAITIREAIVKEEHKLAYYPTVTRYDQIPNITEYISDQYRPKSMEDGYYFATAITVDGYKKILVGIGKKEMPITNTAYTNPRSAGWVYIESGEIGSFLTNNRDILNEEVEMPDNYIDESEVAEETPSQTLENLEIGQYVEYNPTKLSYTVQCGAISSIFYPRATTKWQIFSKDNGQVALISADSVGSLKLQGKEGYRDIGSILTGISNAYVDNNITVSGRALGSSSGSVLSIDEEDNEITWTATRNNTGSPYSDVLHTSDRSTIKDNEALHINSNVWLASRNISPFSEYTYFAARYLTNSNGEGTYNLYFVNANDQGQALEVEEAGVRPIVYLSNEVKITGKGTELEPYKLSK